jgi:high-affinity nickel permease
MLGYLKLAVDDASCPSRTRIVALYVFLLAINALACATAISVVVALLIGGIEALGLIASKLQLAGGFWGTISHLSESLANFGYLVVGIFLLGWALSFALYHWLGFEQKPASP